MRHVNDDGCDRIRSKANGWARLLVLAMSMSFFSSAAHAQVSPCQSDLQLANAAILAGTLLYPGSNFISAGNEFNINYANGAPGGSASVTFQAGNSVCLGPGFHAVATSTGGGFHALIAPTSGWTGRMSTYPAYPGMGNFSIQMFTFTFSDPVAATNISSATILFRDPARGTCQWLYSPVTNGLSYIDPNPAYTSGVVTPGVTNGNIGSPLCSTNLDLSSSTISGTDVTLILTLSFVPGFNASISMQMTTSIAGAPVTIGPVQTGIWIATLAGQFQCTPTDQIPDIPDDGPA